MQKLYITSNAPKGDFYDELFVHLNSGKKARDFFFQSNKILWYSRAYSNRSVLFTVPAIHLSTVATIKAYWRSVIITERDFPYFAMSFTMRKRLLTFFIQLQLSGKSLVDGCALPQCELNIYIYDYVHMNIMYVEYRVLVCAPIQRKRQRKFTVMMAMETFHNSASLVWMRCNMLRVFVFVRDDALCIGMAWTFIIIITIIAN